MHKILIIPTALCAVFLPAALSAVFFTFACAALSSSAQALQSTGQDTVRVSHAQDVARPLSQANIFIYHRFGEDKYPSTNIKLDQFEAHLQFLKEGGFNVLSASEAARALKENKKLPARTAVITVDDAYTSVATEAWPRLKVAGFPMTLFVSTAPVDAGQPGYMTWDTIRQLQSEGVEIGHHGSAHLHMPQAGLDTAVADFRQASARFKQELGAVPKIFAYPYGEYTPELAEALKAEGMEAAFAQFSAPASGYSNLYALPRFALNENYGSHDRFSLVATAKALPVTDRLPLSPLVTAENNPPLFGFSVSPFAPSLKGLACYPSHLGSAAELIFPSPTRVEVRFDKPLPAGRSRINCTLPADSGTFYWVGAFFLRPGAED